MSGGNSRQAGVAISRILSTISIAIMAAAVAALIAMASLALSIYYIMSGNTTVYYITNYMLIAAILIAAVAAVLTILIISRDLCRRIFALNETLDVKGADEGETRGQ